VTTSTPSHASSFEDLFVSLSKEVLVSRRMDTKEAPRGVKGLLVVRSFHLGMLFQLWWGPIERNQTIEGSQTQISWCHKAPTPTSVILDVVSH
jgi:hypothetical protein